MGVSKEYFLRMREHDFNSLTTEQRALFSYIEIREEDEYENNKNDEVYLKLKKKARKASRDVQNYLYDKRDRS